MYARELYSRLRDLIERGENAGALETLETIVEGMDMSARGLWQLLPLSDEAVAEGFWPCWWRVCGSTLAIASSPGEMGVVDDWGWTPPWHESSPYLTEAVCEATVTGHVRPMTCRHMFADLPRLARLDLSCLDTFAVRDMGGMFAGCASLVSLDLSCLDFGSVADVSEMFWGCASLRSLALPAWSPLDGREVCDARMFDGCGDVTLHVPEESMEFYTRLPAVAASDGVRVVRDARRRRAPSRRLRH